MATETIPGGRPPAGPAGKGNKLAAWVKKNPALAGVAGVGGLVGAYVLIKHGQANASSDTGTSSDTSTTDPSTYGTSGDLGGLDYGSGGDDTDIEDQLQGIQDALTGMTQATTPASTTASSTSSGKGSGSQYQPAQKHTLSGAQYQWLKSHNKGAYGSAGGRYTGARGWAWLQAHPPGRAINPGGPKKKKKT